MSPNQKAKPGSLQPNCSATYSIYLLPYFELLTPADVRPLATGVPEQRAKEMEAKFANDARGAVVIIQESPNIGTGNLDEASTTNENETETGPF